ncbi:MAG TPA: glycosyltransferase family 1 protein [Anaerolineae bacterium]|nr:glycosyltransferase family 1 protein [Anaerolineae bacterium]
MSDDSDKPLHVALNAHLLSLAASYRSAGISWYAQNLLRELPAIDPHIRYTVFLNEKRYQGAPGLHLRHTHLPAHQPLVRIFWEQCVQPWALVREGADLLHALALVGPVAGTRPMVLTIHDLSFLHYPQNFHAGKRLYLRLFTKWSVQRAQRVIAISESTRRDILDRYGVPEGKVDRIYYGVDPIFRPLPSDRVVEFRARQRLPDRFLLFVGTLEPRKNVTRLIEAYALLPKGRPPLYIVGGKGWLYDEVFARVEALHLDRAVHFAGHVPGQELPWWYNAAELLVYPSLYEGFGLPPLEAMACGTPVITSGVSSLPEVVGSAGITIDPTDAGALTAAMVRVLAEEEMRRAMKAAGLEQARAFSWQRAAGETVTSYRRALGGGVRRDV